jgi:hypothetical protein
MERNLSRRDLFAASGAGLAALSAAAKSTANGNPGAAPKLPFDSLRNYVAALEANGLVLKIPRVDQDAYQATGLVYRADLYTMFGVPALWFDEVRIDGQWMRGPLLGLLQGNLHTDAVVFGQPLDFDDPRRSYRANRCHAPGILARPVRLHAVPTAPRECRPRACNSRSATAHRFRQSPLPRIASFAPGS